MPSQPLSALVRLVGLPWLAALLGGCTIATPFRQVERPHPEAETFVLVVTHAVVRSGERAEFDRQTRTVAASLRTQPGLLGYAVRREVFGDQAWTLTAWQDEAARARFVYGSTHQTAIAKAAPALRAVRFRRFTLPSAEFPVTWDRAMLLLEQASDQDAARVSRDTHAGGSPSPGDFAGTVRRRSPD